MATATYSSDGLYAALCFGWRTQSTQDLGSQLFFRKLFETDTKTAPPTVVNLLLSRGLSTQKCHHASATDPKCRTRRVHFDARFRHPPPPPPMDRTRRRHSQSKNQRRWYRARPRAAGHRPPLSNDAPANCRACWISGGDRGPAFKGPLKVAAVILSLRPKSSCRKGRHQRASRH